MAKPVRTTIVGGRPPADGRQLQTVPRGLEVLLKKAAVDAGFRGILLADPERAALAIDLQLTSVERSLLRAIGHDAFGQMVANVRVPRRQRPAFLGQAAAVMLAALGVGVTGCERHLTDGISPDRPPPKQEETVDQTDGDAGRATDAKDNGPRAEPEIFRIAGVMVLDNVEPPKPDKEETSQPTVPPGPTTQEVRPDRPRTKGHSADRPPKRTETTTD